MTGNEGSKKERQISDDSVEDWAINNASLAMGSGSGGKSPQISKNVFEGDNIVLSYL